MKVGERVEVRNRFDAKWARGFEVAEVDGEPHGARYRLRRRSDGEVLPAWFTPDEVREERRRETWWI